MKNIINDGIPLAKELARNKESLCIGKRTQKMLEEQIRAEPTEWIEVVSDNGAYQEIVGNKIQFPIKGNEYDFLFLADKPRHGDRITYATFMSHILSSGGRIFLNTRHNITCFSSDMDNVSISAVLYMATDNPVRLIDFTA